MTCAPLIYLMRRGLPWRSGTLSQRRISLAAGYSPMSCRSAGRAAQLCCRRATVYGRGTGRHRRGSGPDGIYTAISDEFEGVERRDREQVTRCWLAAENDSEAMEKTIDMVLAGEEDEA